jgi:hypothetical protein
MKRLSKRAFAAYAERAGIALTWHDGTIVMEDKRPYLFFVLPLGSTKYRASLFGKPDQVIVIAGREPEPPLRDIPVGRLRQLRLLRKYRFVTTTSISEVMDLIALLSKYGAHTGNDVYIFPESGNCSAYVSHHDEVLLTIPLGKSVFNKE